MSTTDRAPIDFTEQSIKALKHEIAFPRMDGFDDIIQLDLDDARNILAELERLRAYAAGCTHCETPPEEQAQGWQCSECPLSFNRDTT